MKKHEFTSPLAETGGENQKKEDHLWFKQKNEHHTMPEEDRKGEIMKKFRKLFAVLTASALVAAMSFTAMAAADIQTTTFAGSGKAKITVTIPASSAENTYKIYRIFEATSDADGHISYKLNNNHDDVPAGFSKDKAGNITYTGTGNGKDLTKKDIDNIKDYVDEADLVATVKTPKDETSFTLEGLPYGYYYISTTTGTVVTVDSTNPNATVSDKNEVPTLDKSITGVISGIGDLDNDGKNALAQVGTTLRYSATIKVGAGAENYVFHDNMSSGLKLEGNVVIEDNDPAFDIAASDYTLETNPGSTTDTIKITFVDEYISKLAKDSVITITYQATVTSDALTFRSVDGKNTATLDYGHSSETNSTPIKSTEVHNAKLTVTKNQPDPDDPEGKKTIPLAGAGFVIKNEAGKYYKYTKDATTNEASVTWVDDITKATEQVSDEHGNVPAFTGLANGKYTLVEKTTPSGYNTAIDQEFTIKAGDYGEKNLEQTATVTNVKGLELPSTGGMGTVAFAVVGLIVMAGAAVTLIIKKRA